MKNRNRILVAIMSALACFSLLPRAQAVSPEVPDEALPGGNTAEGQLALGSLTTGFYNSAFGIYSLLSLTDGNFNTVSAPERSFSTLPTRIRPPVRGRF